ncbi:transmembrane protein 180-like isoform X1 [Branchiostoma lanceolatum]|uniref:transmembrane protein 180-like isoform X1 n=1 Tax=Branchiostoma lanceolatum TaxID=7740 RepID=UPI003452F98A
MGPVMSVPLCYGALVLFTAILHNVFLIYYVDIFVSVYKIDKMSFWIGETIFLIWNSLNDPLFGWMSDKAFLQADSSSEHGSSPQIVLRRFQALFINGPLFALSFLTFWVAWAVPAVQFVVCLCLYDTFLTMVDLHHNALLADLAVSDKERTRLNSYCSVFSAFGSLSVFLSYAIWDKENLANFRIFCAILVCISISGFFLCTIWMKRQFVQHRHQHKEKDPLQSILVSRQKLAPETHPKDRPEKGTKANVIYRRKCKEPNCNNMYIGETSRPLRQSILVSSSSGSSDVQLSVRGYFRQLMAHRNFLWFTAMNLVQVFHCHFNSNFFPLFLENLLEGIPPSVCSVLLGISFIFPHINNLYFLTLCRRYGTYAVIRGLFLVKLVLSTAMMMVGPDYTWVLCFFIASNRVFTEGTCRLLTLVVSDLVDEDYVLNNRKQPVAALVFGMAAFLSKPGQTFAPLMGTWILSVQTGHDIFQTGNKFGSIQPDTSQMDTDTFTSHRLGCFHLLVYVPIVCALLQLLAWSQFSLHGSRLRWIKSQREGGSTYKFV